MFLYLIDPNVPHNSRQVWRNKNLRVAQPAMPADPEAEYRRSEIL